MGSMEDMDAQQARAQTAAETQRTTRRIVAVGAALLAAIAIYLFVQNQSRAADDRQSDVYYCTLEGIGPFDRAPNSGELCADL